MKAVVGEEALSSEDLLYLEVRNRQIGLRCFVQMCVNARSNLCMCSQHLLFQPLL